MVLRAAGTILVAGVLAVATWLTLWLAVGSIGLQRAVAFGPEVLLAEDLPALAAVLAVAGLATLFVGSLMRQSAVEAVAVVVWLLVADGAFAVVAPALIAELTIRHSPTVVVILAAVGAQPLGAAIGGLGGATWRAARR